MKKRWITLVSIALVVLALDHLTKWLIVKNFAFGDGLEIIPSFFDLVHYRNTGAAFGFLAGWDSSFKDLFFYLFATIAVVFIALYVRKLPQNQAKQVVPLALIIGGALGNVSDRFIRGWVVDFLSFHWNYERLQTQIFGRDIDLLLAWPAFNVADMGISIGVFTLIFMTFRADKEAKQDS